MRDVNIFGSPQVELHPQSMDAPLPQLENTAVVGKVFTSEDTLYIIGGAVVGVVQPFVVGRVFKGDAGLVLNASTGVAALGIGLASRFGYIPALPNKADAALIGYGATTLALTILGEILKRWG
jgi:hypothetical protein